MREPRVPIGTILKMKDTQMMVVGYTIAKGKDRPEIAYAVVPHPLGYLNQTSIHYVERSKAEVISLGYVAEEFKVLERFQNSLDEGFENAPKDATEKFYNLLNKGDEIHAE